MDSTPLEIIIDDNDDLDSTYGGSEAQSETHTVASSIWDYVYENGRRYNSYKSGAYWGPNDSTHQGSLDITHHLFRLTLGGNIFMAPIGPSPQKVLDLGTGTGIWAIEFGDLYPNAKVIGTDLSPIQPLLVPPNVFFEIDDYEQEWVGRAKDFDFIHARATYGSVSDHQTLYRRIFDHLTPGGWFEATEVGVVPYSDDDTLKGTTLESWGSLSIEAGERFGKTTRTVDLTEGFMRNAGFVNIQYGTCKWPLGPWAKDKRMKEIGTFNRVNWDEGMEGWLMWLFTNLHGVRRLSVMSEHY